MVRSKCVGAFVVGVGAAWMLVAGATSAAAQTALPAGGGEPGAAYLACQETIRGGSFEGMVACLAAEPAAEIAETDPDEAQEMFEFIQMMQATDIKVLGGSVDGDSATLNVEGMQEGEKATGTVTMVREDGVWKIAGESWQG